MNNSDQTILLAVDLTDESLFRIERSFDNLPLLAGKVILLYVFENLSHISSDEDRNKLVFEKDTMLNGLAKNIHEKTGIEVRPVIQKGKAHEEILKAAESYSVNLIAMSTHTHKEDDYTQKHTLGTTTSRVVRESKVPVLTFNSNVLLKQISKILLPLDLTVETKQKVTNAIDMALRFEASIAVVSVLLNKSYTDIKMELQQQLEQVKSFIEEDGIKCTAELIETEGGTKALTTSILKYSNDVDADLIMIMTQQETKLVDFFVGSSAQTIIRLADVPVMSVIPKELWL